MVRFEEKPQDQLLKVKRKISKIQIFLRGGVKHDKRVRQKAVRIRTARYLDITFKY